MDRSDRRARLLAQAPPAKVKNFRKADMRLSTKGRYAVMAMTDLAARSGERAVTLADIARRQQISLAYLEQLFVRLRRAGLVISVRGPGGGYRLGQPAAETSIARIVQAVDEPLRATRCASHEQGCMAGGERCLTHDLWEEVGSVLEDYLASVSLHDVLSRRIGARARAAA